ncbi:MAG: hypothetical protein LBH43_02395, partial [Treponema sp.]|nr:hypothetical protein [Treponema sp.]
MKKFGICLLVTLTVLAVFACTLPTYVEIKASPELTFPAVSDFGEKFVEIMREKMIPSSEVDMEYKILECDNSKLDTMTCVVYSSLIGPEQDSRLQEVLNDFWNDVLQGVPEDQVSDNFLLRDVVGFIPDMGIPVIDNKSGDPISITMENFADFMEGFIFTSLDSKVYADGTDIIECLDVYIHLLNNDGTTLTTTKITRKDKLSGIDTAWETCPWPEIPDWGNDIDGVDQKMNTLEDLKFRYEVFLDEDATKGQLREWKDSSQIRSELIIWFPFDFIAGPNGADFKIPDVFSADEDVFGRTKDKTDDLAAEITASIKSLQLQIRMKKNPFEDGILFVESGKDGKDGEVGKGAKSGPLEFKFDETSFIMDFTEAKLKKVNETVPFIPQLRARFEEGGHLNVPREFKTTELYFKARIDYKKKISELG